jgi:hypothetical protein
MRMQTSKILSLAVVTSLSLCCPQVLCKSQKKIPPADYDFYALAISSIADVTTEASKLPDVPQRVKVLIEAAKILQPAKKDEAVRLLEIVLRDLREWGSADDASWRQRNMAATLRNEALAMYALVDSEKALARRREIQSLEKTVSSAAAVNLKSFNSWHSHFNERRTAAEVLTITRVNALVKQKKIIEAQQRAESISSDETRAWALLAVATAAAKEDKVLGFESISKALKALNAASPSPHKAELALLATAMLVKDDSRRAFETLAVAVKYANSSEPKDSAQARPAFAFGLETRIGEMQTRLGVVPLSLSEIRIDPTLSALAATDWFRADQIVSDIREPSLRLPLKLQFAGAVLAKELKSKKSQAVQKSSAKN